MAEFNDSKPVTTPAADPAVINAQAQRVAQPDLGPGAVPGDASAEAMGGSHPLPATGWTDKNGQKTQPNTDPNAVPGSVEAHHGMLASIFQDLAGGKKTTWRQTENGPVAVKENLQPGEMARGILAAALTGLASGYKYRGPNARGASMAAGFEGNEDRVDKQEVAKKNAAQQEFTNKNVSDEMTIRKMQNARDQQRSIDEHQESAQRTELTAQNISQGKIRNLHENDQYFIQQQNDWNLAMSAGMKPLANSPEFTSNEELTQWLDKNAKTAIQPGKFNTVIKTDPYTGRFVILQKPKGWDDAQWVGVKVDANGNPEKDKDGNMLANGDFRGPDGKPRVPAGQMSPHQLYDSQIRLLDLRSKELSRLEALERLKNMRRERAKDEQINKAEVEWNAAGGNPDAIDSKTGNFVMSPTSRNVVRQTFIKEASAEATLLNSIQREMDRVGAPGPNASPEDKQQWLDMTTQANEARTNLRQLQINMGLLGRVPNVADVSAGNIRSEYTKDDGSYDEPAALKAADSITAPSAIKQQIRQKLSAQPANRPESQLNAVLGAIQKVPADQQIEYIGKSGLSKHDKDWLTGKLKTGQATATAAGIDLSTTDPTDTVFTSPNGGTETIPNDAADAFAERHPNYTRVGVGKKIASADSGLAQK